VGYSEVRVVRLVVRLARENASAADLAGLPSSVDTVGFKLTNAEDKDFRRQKEIYNLVNDHVGKDADRRQLLQDVQGIRRCSKR
jgi:hypothetical protein